ncbi:SfnB family sulfur acquisition oxidoreductase [Antrihabitans cavernicola]|uniref:SfnB family sulfur acquisition oxidoreductase n=1 Tax=Antrihabitans cavernicola TaxID=2495913 RepID=A0A5A7S2J3_9NOCA|nr:SfnB family sulfur acquisition oxidoreductase [Spelaeibacter cavernicola]KAA0017377.1 SfnB family sulfur acquisition oxidoreductase [Spelaeibacter cavernicola]
MTTSLDVVVLADADEALASTARLAAEFHSGASEREQDRRLPAVEIEQLSQAGIYAATVPATYGGADVPPSVLAEIIRRLAYADPNIAQIPHSHFVYVHLLKVAATPEQQEFFFGELLAGKRFANAQSERGGKTITDIATTFTPDGDGFRLTGAKYYCTGTLFANWIPVLARLDDPEERSSLLAGDYVLYVPADSAGLHIADDWNALGQKLTGSGTVTLDNVAVQPDWVVPRSPAFDGPTSYGAYAQLLHAAIDVGIARAALDEAKEFVRTKSRPWFEAKVDNAVDDPLLVQRFGELTVSVATAEATLVAAGIAVDTAFAQASDDAAQAASVAVAVAKVVGERSALEVSSAIFEVSGTRSAGAELNLDRHWRNARTHTLHDPARWKYQHIGSAVLRDDAPPRHGLI